MRQPYLESATALSDNYTFLLFSLYPIGLAVYGFTPPTPSPPYSLGNNSPTTQPNKGSSERATGYHLFMKTINKLNKFN